MRPCAIARKRAVRRKAVTRSTLRESGPGPKAQRTEARPLESVRCTESITLPPPESTVNTTFTPASGRPVVESRASTVGFTLTKESRGAACACARGGDERER